VEEEVAPPAPQGGRSRELMTRRSHQKATILEMRCRRHYQDIATASRKKVVDA
jgi:hypothetical protein